MIISFTVPQELNAIISYVWDPGLKLIIELKDPLFTSKLYPWEDEPSMLNVTFWVLIINASIYALELVTVELLEDGLFNWIIGFSHSSEANIMVTDFSSLPALLEASTLKILGPFCNCISHSKSSK